MDKIIFVKGKLKQKIELYGIRGTIQRILTIMSHLSFCITGEQCDLMSRTLDAVCPPPERNDIEVREIKMEDYENELWHDFFTEEKKLIYNERFKNKNAKGYGVFINDVLAYSTWILYKTIMYSEKKILFEDETSALLLDSYAHPLFRGMGLHNYMNIWRLNEMKKNGVKTAYGIVLSYNVPAIKTQENSGLKIDQIFYVYSIGNKVYVNRQFDKNSSKI